MMTTEHKVSTPKLNGINGTNGTPGTPKRQSSNPLVLLVGKLVFLDLNSSYKPLSKVKRCLNLIGAVSHFFLNIFLIQFFNLNLKI